MVDVGFWFTNEWVRGGGGVRLMGGVCGPIPDEITKMKGVEKTAKVLFGILYLIYILIAF